VIGSEFYLMERRRGLIIRGKAPAELANSPELRRRVCESFIENLATLHSLDYESARLGDLGKPEGYVRRQVEGWTKRYYNAKTDEWRDLESAIEWLNKSIPPETDAALVHNDYKFDNIMLDPEDLTRITAVLDWEMVTVGDPLMDLGTTLGYWMSREAGDTMLNMPFNPRVLMENISRTELADMYASLSGRDVSNLLFYYVFGTFKIAVIAQQIYARFAKGLTRDPRFAAFDRFVEALGRLASFAISTGKV
jgi:aminoglycoside phosphotransferase (APT) family kinase protein